MSTGQVQFATGLLGNSGTYSYLRGYVGISVIAGTGSNVGLDMSDAGRSFNLRSLGMSQISTGGWLNINCLALNITAAGIILGGTKIGQTVTRSTGSGTLTFTNGILTSYT
jgi:hypothetical protein